MSDKNILDQLINDANVIGYKPDLEYKKERTATGEIIPGEEAKDYDPDKDFSLYTKTLNGFAENTPSSVLDDINYVLNNIKRLKSNLAQRFNEDQALKNNPFYKKNDLNSHNFNENPANPTGNVNNPNNPMVNPKNPSDSGGSNGNTQDPSNPYQNIDQLIDANNEKNKPFTKRFADEYDNPTGSIIPKLINQLSDIEHKLKDLDYSIKETYYGNLNIPLEKAKELDNTYVSNMKIMERNKNNGSINYLTLSFDSLLNKTMSYCVFQDNKSAIKVAKVIDSHEDTQATINDMNILSKLYEDIDKELDIRSRGYQKNEDEKLIQKSMYNYYEKRKYLNDIYSLYRSNPESKFLGRKTMEYVNNLNDAIKNVNRVLLYNQNYLNQITNLEKQKYNIQKISGSISSNS